VVVKEEERAGVIAMLAWFRVYLCKLPSRLRWFCGLSLSGGTGAGLEWPELLLAVKHDFSGQAVVDVLDAEKECCS
jgi:hypothetical protein